MLFLFIGVSLSLNLGVKNGLRRPVWSEWGKENVLEDEGKCAGGHKGYDEVGG